MAPLTEKPLVKSVGKFKDEIERDTFSVADKKASDNSQTVDNRPDETLPIKEKATSKERESEKKANEKDDITAVDKPKKVRRRGRKRRKMHEVSVDNDIKYRGPLSYRHLKIFAWLALAFSHAALIMATASRMDAGLAEQFSTFVAVFNFIGGFALPLFLLANFSIILSAKTGYKRLFLMYGLLTAIIIVLYFLVCEHYATGVLSMLTGDREIAHGAIANILIPNILTGKHIGFNLFMDLFLCVLVTYFLNYEPRRLFKGKKLIVFRLLALIPIVYEAASIGLKTYASFFNVALPYYIYPFLTTKPPITFVVFVFLALFIKLRERRFLKRGKTREEYRAFLKTNVNSLHFSIYTSIIFLVAALIDFILLVVLSGLVLVVKDYPEITGEVVLAAIAEVASLGVGSGTELILIIPIIMLFSYNRGYKPSSIDTIIPIVGIALIVFVYLEGVFQIIFNLPEILKNLLGL